MSKIKFDPNVENPSMPETAAYAELFAVRRLIGELYNAAHWTADRPVPDEAELWERLRDAIGQLPGQSPEPLPFPGIRIEFSIPTLRQLAAKVRKAKGGEFTSTQVKAFLTLHGEDLHDKLNQVVREFLKEKLG